MTDQRPKLDAQKHGGVLKGLFTRSPKQPDRTYCGPDDPRAHGFRGHCLSRPGDQR